MIGTKMFKGSWTIQGHFPCKGFFVGNGMLGHDFYNELTNFFKYLGAIF